MLIMEHSWKLRRNSQANKQQGTEIKHDKNRWKKKGVCVRKPAKVRKKNPKNEDESIALESKNKRKDWKITNWKEYGNWNKWQMRIRWLFHDVFTLNSFCYLNSKVEEKKGYFSCLSCRTGTVQHPYGELLAHVSVQSTVTTFHLLDKNEPMQIT